MTDKVATKPIRSKPIQLIDRLLGFKKTAYQALKDLHDNYNTIIVSIFSSELQNKLFPKNIELAEGLIIVIVPEINVMGGGVNSLFSIAKELRRTKPIHRHEVIVMTRPQRGLFPKTYFRNTHLINLENVYRFKQLRRCKNLSHLQILIPEYACTSFSESLSQSEKKYLEGIQNLSFRIVNQNIDLMPEPTVIGDLIRLTRDITMSVGHHSYNTQEVSDRFGLPTLLLPAYIDLSDYPTSTFFEKKKLVIYSPDETPFKKDVLSSISRAFPDFELREIRDVSFETYMDLATQCMFSVTFGEGFDGYFIQPMQQGGVSFAVHNTRFFPPQVTPDQENIFSSYDEMAFMIGAKMKQLATNAKLYTELSKKWQNTIDTFYKRDDYRRRIQRLLNGEFDFHPLHRPISE